MATSEVVELAGLKVEGARVDLGTVPLDVTVTPTWTITNTSSEVVHLGEPHASVIEGCCPGPISLSDVTLDPGESSDYLTLKVVGDFSG